MINDAWKQNCDMGGVSAFLYDSIVVSDDTTKNAKKRGVK